MFGKPLRYLTLPLLLFLSNSSGNSAPRVEAISPNGFNPGPDVIAGNMTGLYEDGSTGTQHGLAVGITSCNTGNVVVGFAAMPSTNHPAVAQNLYRMSGGTGNDERFEQIGQSWVKHTYGAKQANSCGFGCLPGGDFNHLGVGCSDTYANFQSATQSDLGSRAWINPFTGVFPSTARDHTGHVHTAVSHMMVVEGTDLNTVLNPGANYYAELLYVTSDEYAWCQAHAGECNMNNNSSYRRYSVSGTTSFTFAEVGSTLQMTPPVYAWTGATVNVIEPAPGSDGRALIAYKVTGPVGGVWHYEYAIYNQNLDRAIQSFSIPLGCGITLSNLGFHAPANHPGFPNDGTVGDAGFSNAAWTANQTGSDVSWSTETFAQNQNANAIRWGTLYNFRFDSDKPPLAVNATISFFKTGTPVTVDILGPNACDVVPTPTPTPTVTPGISPTVTPTPPGTPTPTPIATPSPIPTPILPPAANGKIAFESLRSGSGVPDIWVMDANGANPVNLTNSPAIMDQYPAWSPDGTRIAFSSNRYGNYQILIMNADGANPVRVTNNAVNDYEPRWSPDGQKLAFVSNRDGNLEIYVMNADGSNQTRLTNTPQDEHDPAWSPDGGRIAFVSERDSDFEIYLMNADGSNQVNLTNRLGLDSSPAWSPDGTQIAFQSSRSGSGIFRMNPDGTNVIRVSDNTSATDAAPAWSPDGTKVAFNRTPIGGFADIWLIGANGLSPINITNDPSTDMRPDWQRVALTVVPPAQPLNLSTRVQVKTGDNVGIAGFIINGTAPKHLLLRAIGPSLSSVSDRLADPMLELHRPGAATITNDNWRDDPVQEAAIIATGIPPTNDLEAAIDITLNPGAYTAIIRGQNDSTGVALIEVYDLSPAVLAKVANISTRAFVGTGSDVVIAGFILGGNSGNDGIVVRGVGPSLTAFGVPNALANPTLELRDGNATLLAANNDWQENAAQAAELIATGLAPANPLESALSLILPPGLYTAVLAGQNTATGVGLVEVYDRGTGSTPSFPPGPCIQDFDGVAAGNLPTGWDAIVVTGDFPSWVTSGINPSSPPNDLFVNDQDGISQKSVTSSPILINSASATLSFRNSFQTEHDPPPAEAFWDGFVLDVSVNGGPFNDVTDPVVGGTFVSGGYTGRIEAAAANPLAGRMAWSGYSGGYINTVIHLGPNVVGQSIRLRFTMGTDEAVAAPGARVDTLVLTGGSCSYPSPSPSPTIPPNPCTEGFDQVTSPGLPPGWTAGIAAGDFPTWETTTTQPDTPPNDVFVNDQNGISDKFLESPVFTVASAASALSFRNSFNTEHDPPPAEVFWDGYVLEISVNGGPYVDVTDPAVGGTFTSGGYTGPIDTTANNPLAGRMAWSGNSGGYINTLIQFPASLNGQFVRFRFRMGTDEAASAPGVQIDNFLFAAGGPCP